MPRSRYSYARRLHHSMCSTRVIYFPLLLRAAGGVFTAAANPRSHAGTSWLSGDHSGNSSPHCTGQAPPLMAPRQCPPGDCIKASIALPNRELWYVQSSAIGHQKLDLLGKYRIAVSGEPHCAISARRRSAELLRMAAAEEKGLVAEPKAAKQAHLCQHDLVGAAERTLQRCPQQFRSPHQAEYLDAHEHLVHYGLETHRRVARHEPIVLFRHHRPAHARVVKNASMLGRIRQR